VPAFDADGGLVLLLHSLDLGYGRRLGRLAGGRTSGVVVPVALHSVVILVRSIVKVTPTIIESRMVCGRMVGLGRGLRYMVVNGSTEFSRGLRFAASDVVSMARCRTSFVGRST